LKKSRQLGKTNWDAVIRVYDSAGNVIENTRARGWFQRVVNSLVSHRVTHAIKHFRDKVVFSGPSPAGASRNLANKKEKDCLAGIVNKC